MTNRSGRRFEILRSPKAVQGRSRDQDDTRALHRGRKGKSLHTEAGYTAAILSLSTNAQGLANREETLYGLRALTSLSLARSDGLRSPEILEMALFHALGKLPEPKLVHEFHGRAFKLGGCRSDRRSVRQRLS